MRRRGFFDSKERKKKGLLNLPSMGEKRKQPSFEKKKGNHSFKKRRGTVRERHEYVHSGG